MMFCPRNSDGAQRHADGGAARRVHAALLAPRQGHLPTRGRGGTLEVCGTVAGARAAWAVAVHPRALRPRLVAPGACTSTSISTRVPV